MHTLGTYLGVCIRYSVALRYFYHCLRFFLQYRLLSGSSFALSQSSAQVRSCDFQTHTLSIPHSLLVSFPLVYITSGGCPDCSQVPNTPCWSLQGFEMT